VIVSENGRGTCAGGSKERKSNDTAFISRYSDFGHAIFTVDFEKSTFLKAVNVVLNLLGYWICPYEMRDFS